MTDRPILFRPEMVAALLAGTKSQTRRPAWRWSKMMDALLSGKPTPIGKPTAAQLIRPGDLIYVRESCHNWKAGDVWRARWLRDADDSECATSSTRDRPGRRSSMHMPRRDSRLTLEVTAVRIERLQEITEADAIAEGLIAQNGDGGAPGAGYKWRGVGYHGGTVSSWGRCFHAPQWDGSPGCSCSVGGPSPAQCAYRELYEHIHGPGAWDTNPEVVVISFDVHKANIDAFKGAA